MGTTGTGGLTPPSAPTPTSSPSTSPEPLLNPGEDVDLTSWESIREQVGESIEGVLTGVVNQIPLIILGLVFLAIGLVVARVAQQGVVRATDRERTDPAAARLIQTTSWIVLVTLVVLLSLSVAGVNIGAVLAGLGIAGLAIAFAMQSILANFIAGMLILIRRPFRPGDQVRLGEFEGTVTDINMRVTTIVEYDGEKVLLPNAKVFDEPITNTTERGRRRTEVTVSVDYRDDHDRARELLFSAVQEVEGVLSEPPPRVLLSELAESGVQFRVQYWTLPQQAEVNGVRDRVLGAAKSAVEADGMTIPWPIRTLVVDPDSAPLRRADGSPQDRQGSGADDSA